MKGSNEKLWLEEHLFVQSALGENNFNILKVTLVLGFVPCIVNQPGKKCGQRENLLAQRAPMEKIALRKRLLQRTIFPAKGSVGG